MMPLKDIGAQLDAEAQKLQKEREEKKAIAKGVFGTVMGVGATLFLASIINLHDPMDLLASAAMIYYVVVGARATT